jgi:hypothetical protein
MLIRAYHRIGHLGNFIANFVERVGKANDSLDKVSGKGPNFRDKP